MNLSHIFPHQKIHQYLIITQAIQSRGDYRVCENNFTAINIGAFNIKSREEEYDYENYIY